MHSLSNKDLFTKITVLSEKLKETTMAFVPVIIGLCHDREMYLCTGTSHFLPGCTSSRALSCSWAKKEETLKEVEIGVDAGHIM